MDLAGRDLAMMTIDSGLFLERAREPDAFYFAPGHIKFAGREPGLLSQFLLDIFYSSPSALTVAKKEKKIPNWPFFQFSHLIIRKPVNR